MLRAVLATLFVMLCLVVTAPANAQEQAPTLPYDRYADPVDPPPKPGATKPEKPFSSEKPYESYGVPMALIDVGAFALLAASYANTDNAVVARTTFGHSLGIYGLVPPIIHCVNAEPLRGFASLGLRVGSPLVGALGAQFAAYVLVGFKDTLTGEHDADDVGAAPAVVGATLAALAAAVIDDYFLARRYAK